MSLIYSMLMSVDGYVEDEHGRFDCAKPDEEVNVFINQITSSVGTYLYGRRIYESMVYWETAHTIPNLPRFLRDWTRQWLAARNAGASAPRNNAFSNGRHATPGKSKSCTIGVARATTPFFTAMLSKQGR
jgi:hypothetical protein